MTIAVIQARMTSTRLPGKVLLPLPFPDGEPLLEAICQKLRKSTYITKIVVAIPEASNQSLLRTFLLKKTIDFIEGSETDVLSRFVKAVEQYKPDNLVRITADNPFLDLGMLEHCVKTHRQSGVDYTLSSGLPYGMNMEIIKADSLFQLHTSREINDEDREHVTLGFSKLGHMKSQVLKLSNEDLGHIRVTVDTPEDYMRAALLYGLQQSSKHEGDLEFIKMAYSKYPYLF